MIIKNTNFIDKMFSRKLKILISQKLHFRIF